MRTIPVRGAVAALSLLLAPAAAHAATLSGHLTPATIYADAPAISGVTTAGGWTAWSAQQPDKTWKLTLRAADGTITTPLATARKIPFDAVLGTGSGGAMTLAYSACTKDPTYSAGGVDLAWFTARGCRIHLLDPATGTDTARALTPGSASDALPAVGGGRLAFTTLNTKKRTASLVVTTLGSGKPAKKLFTGPAFRKNTSQADIGQSPLATAVDAKHVAVNWVYYSGADAAQGVGFPTFETKLITVMPNGKALTLMSGSGSSTGDCSGYTDLRSLSIVGGSAVAEVVGPTGWELTKVALTQPAKVLKHKATPKLTYGDGGGPTPTDTDSAFLAAIGTDGTTLAFTVPAADGKTIAVGASPLGAFKDAGSRLDDPYQCG